MKNNLDAVLSNIEQDIHKCLPSEDFLNSIVMEVNIHGIEDAKEAINFLKNLHIIEDKDYKEPISSMFVEVKKNSMKNDIGCRKEITVYARKKREEE